jgi:hypothetical protein
MNGRRTKGTHVLHVVKILRMNRDRALELLAPDLHHYLSERILPSSWYSSDDHLSLLRAVVKTMPKGQDAWITMGRVSARMDLEGAYKQFFRTNDPEATLRVLPAVWRSTHDSGKISFALETPTSVVFKMVDYPVMTDEICRITTGYIMEALHVAGACGAEVAHSTCIALRAPECTWHAYWKSVGG